MSDINEPGRYQLSPKTIFIHGEWNPSNTEYDADISLLEFEIDSIHLNPFVQPICIWNSENEPNINKGEVVGWGQSEDKTRNHETVPKIVTALIQANEKCFLKTNALVKISSLRTFCAGLSDGSGVCKGDSGGGLFIKIDGIYHLKGIVSSSLLKGTECDVSVNAVYTNVPKFKNWIEEKTGGVVMSSLGKIDNIS